MTTGYTGISYPFRVSSQGGAVISTTNKMDSTHIEESIQQILGTHEGERPMESDIFSELDSLLFEQNDESLQALLIDTIVECLEKLEDRIEIDEEGVEFVVEAEEDENILYALITYKVLKYNTVTTSKVKIGEVTS